MKILVINCGSSSLKYEVYQMPNQLSLGKGLVERIGLPEGRIVQDKGEQKYQRSLQIPNHRVAFEQMMLALLDPQQGLLKDIKEISGIGHRVVHGGEQYSESVVIDKDVINAIEIN